MPLNENRGLKLVIVSHHWSSHFQAIPTTDFHQVANISELQLCPATYTYVAPHVAPHVEKTLNISVLGTVY